MKYKGNEVRLWLIGLVLMSVIFYFSLPLGILVLIIIIIVKSWKVFINIK